MWSLRLTWHSLESFSRLASRDKSYRAVGSEALVASVPSTPGVTGCVQTRTKARRAQGSCPASDIRRCLWGYFRAH